MFEDLHLWALSAVKGFSQSNMRVVIGTINEDVTQIKTDTIGIYIGAGGTPEQYLDGGYTTTFYMTINVATVEHLTAIMTIDEVTKGIMYLMRYPHFETWQLLNAEISTMPSFTAKLENDMWLYSSIMELTIYTKKENQNERINDNA